MGCAYIFRCIHPFLFRVFCKLQSLTIIMDFITSDGRCQYWISRNDLLSDEHKDLVEKLPVSSEGFDIKFRCQQMLKREYSPHRDWGLL
uniref:Uncharacterized protein n=1 Tax=Rhizophora mucronata TaxID=61149 RepID=A0A2P2P977_RHIMU